MKKIKKLLLICLITNLSVEISTAQVEKNSLILNLGYYNVNNKVQYLKANAKTKIEGKFTPVAGADLGFYIKDNDPAHLLGVAKTDKKGDAFLMMPPKAKDEWNKSTEQTFLVVADSTLSYKAGNTSIDLKKARIRLDTAGDGKIEAMVVEQKESAWIPASGVDVKIAIKRLGGDLNVNEEPTFTTDSTGKVSADFKQLNLPGDSVGNLVLIASVEDNDLFGNLSAEKIVPWGTPASYNAEFNKRTLFARRGYSPVWLIWMAAGITGGVWIILFYLTFQIRKLKKLGV